jgi:hypothetical protein
MDAFARLCLPPLVLCAIFGCGPTNPQGGANGGAGGNAGASGGGSAGQGSGFEGEGDPWMQAAPRASCGEGDVPDPGVQGLEGNLRCNLSVLGQAPAPHFLSAAWYKNCAYVNGATGTTVIDVTNSSSPRVVRTLTTTGMQSNWETMKVHEGRGLLAGYQSNGPILDVYDVSGDCTNPVLQKSLSIGGTGHAGQFSTDGTIYYASSMYTSQVFPVDVSDPTNPRIIPGTIPRGAHDLFIGKNGTRGYFAMPNLLTGLGVGSVGILDLSSIQARSPGASATLIHEWSWPDGNVSQYPIAVTYGGKDYLLITDELGSGNCADPNKPPYGYAHIFDISDERNPKLASRVRTEAQGPCTGVAPGGGGFGVGTHYCNVDRLADPRLLSCGNWAGGARVFDIRNPWRPKEIAYFDVAGEMTPGLTRIHLERRELWVAMAPGTFYVLKFRDGVLEPIIGN